MKSLREEFGNRSDAGVPSIQSNSLNLLEEAFLEKNFWSWSWIVFGTIAILKGMRLPNLWAATEQYIDYDLGFVKRGLFGATLGKLFGLQRYDHVVELSYAIFLVFTLLLGVMIVRSGALHSASGRIVVSVFAGSFALTYLAHIVGYLDIFLAALELIYLVLPSPRLRSVAVWPICVVGVLVHEQFLFAFLPLILLQLKLDDSKNPRASFGKWKLVALGGLVILLVACLSLRPPLSEAATYAYRDHLAKQADFTLRDDSFVVLQRSSVQNILGTFKDLIGLRGGLKFIGGLVMVLPCGFFILFLANRALGASDLKRWVLFAGLSPLLLGLVGWDFPRWDALLCLQALLIFLVIYRDRPIRGETLGAPIRNAAFFLIAIGLATGKPLMDRAEIDSFPEYHLAKQLAGSIKSHHLLPPDH